MDMIIMMSNLATGELRYHYGSILMTEDTPIDFSMRDTKFRYQP